MNKKDGLRCGQVLDHSQGWGDPEQEYLFWWGERV